MPKTITTDGKATLAAEVTRLCLILHVTRRDGEEFFFTDHDANLVIGGDTYVSSVGWTRNAIARDSQMAVDNSSLTAMIDDVVLTTADMRAGKFDLATLEVEAVLDWNDLTIGTLYLGRCFLGEVVRTPSDLFTTEVRGLAQLLQTNVGDTYTPSCAPTVDLGDIRCKMPIYPALIQRTHGYVKAAAAAYGDAVRVVLTADADSRKYSNVYFECTTSGTTASSAPTFDATVGNTTTDGGVVWTCRNAWTRSAVVASVADSGTFTITVTEPRAVDDWFRRGVIEWETGDNAGRNRDVKNWTQSSSTVVLQTPMEQPVQVGDRLAISVGCDRAFATCKAKFTNQNNFRGFPHVPGNDFIIKTPPGISGGGGGKK